MSGLERAYRRVKSDPISIRWVCFECFRMHLIQHDVNVEMLLVVVGKVNLTVQGVLEKTQSVAAAEAESSLETGLLCIRA
jgi:hypothetical protein